MVWPSRAFHIHSASSSSYRTMARMWLSRTLPMMKIYYAFAKYFRNLTAIVSGLATITKLCKCSVAFVNFIWIILFIIFVWCYAIWVLHTIQLLLWVLNHEPWMNDVWHFLICRLDMTEYWWWWHADTVPIFGTSNLD